MLKWQNKNQINSEILGPLANNFYNNVVLRINWAIKDVSWFSVHESYLWISYFFPNCLSSKILKIIPRTIGNVSKSMFMPKVMGRKKSALPVFSINLSNECWNVSIKWQIPMDTCFNSILQREQVAWRREANSLKVSPPFFF